MTQPIDIYNHTYSMPCTNAAISSTTLRVMQWALGISLLLGVAFGISGLCQSHLPSWAYSLDIGVICASFLGLVSIFIVCKPIQLLARHDIPWISPDQISKKSKELLNELCERDLKKEPIDCTFERVEAILSELKQAGDLHILNSTPSYYIGLNRPFFSRFPPPKYTPLQYWASKGDLKIVKLLIEHGALDYCANTPQDNTSALFEAAFGGHVEVVKHLLSCGACADIPFDGSVLHYFIPKFVSRMSYTLHDTWDYQNAIECLEMVLASLSKGKPDNLSLQLKIPVKKRNGCSMNALELMNQAVYPNNNAKQSSMIQQLVQLLTRFGADPSEVFSVNELQAKNMNIGCVLFLCDGEILK